MLIGESETADTFADLPFTLHFAEVYGLPPADGRWLYAYRLPTAMFERLQRDLAARGRLEGLATGVFPALFVLWASEWLRRSYRGGGYRWTDLVAVLGVAEDQARLRDITARGLRSWGRPVIAGDSAREYLGSLAREGGFPAAAIKEGGRGWALDLLKAVVGRLLAEPTAGNGRAYDLAFEQRLRLPQVFRDEAFVALCGDLALAIVQLRREVDALAASAGLPLVAWLRLHRPDWAAALPLTTGERAAEALLEPLMSVEAVCGGGVGVERLLVRDGAAWLEAVRIALDGALDGATMRYVRPSEGRLRAFAAARMAESMPGELAMLDPPAAGGTRWEARATRAAGGVRRLPFSTAVELDLRAGENRVARITLTGGKPRRGALLVAVDDGAERSGAVDAPTLLRVVGSGSGLYRADTLYVRMPGDWRIDVVADGGGAAPIGRGVGGTQLWRIEGGATVADPDGDRFQVRCGQPGDVANRIDLIGETPHWAESAGDVDLFAGPPVASTSRAEGALCVRMIGTRTWRRAPSPLPIGHYDLGWLVDGMVLDRRRVAVIPAAASLTRTGTPRRPEYVLTGFGECALRPAADAPVAAAEDGTRWRAHEIGRTVHWFAAAIVWPDAPDLPVRVAHPCAAAIARWDGTILPDRTRVTLADLPGLVAVAEGRVQMVGWLARDGRHSADLTWTVVDELPLASIADDVASLLLPCSIDAEVRLAMHDGREGHWLVRQFAVDLQRRDGGLIVYGDAVPADAILVGRALAHATEEVAFGAFSVLGEVQVPVRPPEDLTGDWLIYLRCGETVLSRPLFHRGLAPAAAPTDALGLAMTNAPGRPLDTALLGLLRDAAADRPGTDAVLQSLASLIGSLRGLPPATFRVLDLLVRCPAVLARLAFLAPPERRDAVLALSDGLPFAWCLIARRRWEDAQRRAFEGNMAVLAPLGADAPRYAMEAVATVRTALIAREPLLAPVFVGRRAAQSAEGIVQAFLNRAVDRVAPSRGNRYRARLGARLPAYLTGFDPGVVETLDAPFAAALAVQGAWDPGIDDVRHLKTVARTFPAYFADAFAAALEDAA